jgi:hypothetical protein
MKWTLGKAAAAAAVLALAPAVGFAQEQRGLVNVGVIVEDNVVVAQVPVGIAAQVCADVDANIIARQFVGTDDIVCEITQEVAADNNIDHQS